MSPDFAFRHWALFLIVWTKERMNFQGDRLLAEIHARQVKPPENHLETRSELCASFIL